MDLMQHQRTESNGLATSTTCQETKASTTETQQNVSGHNANGLAANNEKTTLSQMMTDEKMMSLQFADVDEECAAGKTTPVFDLCDDLKF